jgi:hypothetical protein
MTSKPFVVQAHPLQDGGSQAMELDPIFAGSEPEVLRGSVAETLIYSAAGHPDGVTMVFAFIGT